MRGTRNEVTDLTSRDATPKFFFASHVLCNQIFSLNIVNLLVYFHKQKVSHLNFSGMFELVSFTLKQNNTNRHTENEAALVISGMVASEH